MNLGTGDLGMLDQIAEELGDGLVVIDGAGRVLLANRVFRDQLGGRERTFEGCQLRDLTAEGTEEILRSGETRDVTVKFRSCHGPIVEHQCRVKPLVQNGETVGFAAVSHSGEAELRLAEARERLIAIIESSDDVIISKDLNGIVTSWNPAAEKTFGYRAEEMIGRPIQVLFPEDRLHEEDEILRRLRKGERVDHFETVRVTKDGRQLDISVTISPIREPSGRIIGASKVARVITERKLAELALRESAENLRGLNAVLEQRVQERTAELEKAFREMEGFTYTISHDLRAPLRAIVANCRILEEDYGNLLPAEALDHFTRQKNAALRMAQLIDDLLRLSRLSRQEMVRESLDVTEMTKSVVLDLREDVNVPFDADVQPNMRAIADRTLLRLALANLIENAVKFAKPGETPRVTVGSDDGVFFVRDEGIGFDAKYVHKIFLPFERLHLETDYPGTGIGLANVKRIIERHGGQVWAESKPGQGATFYFTVGSAPI